jgi:hypothetical protein
LRESITALNNVAQIVSVAEKSNGIEFPQETIFANCNTVILEKLIMFQPLRNFPVFLKPESFLLCSQNPTSGHYPNSFESNGHPHLLRLKV